MIDPDSKWAYTDEDKLRGRAVSFIATVQRALNKTDVTMDELLMSNIRADEAQFWHKYPETLNLVRGWYQNQFAWEAARDHLHETL